MFSRLVSICGLLLLAIVGAACADADPTPTDSPPARAPEAAAPTRAPTPVPATPTRAPTPVPATPTPTPAPTPEPVEEAAPPERAAASVRALPTLPPGPEQEPGANLMVLDRADWAGPVVVSTVEKTYLDVGPVSVDDIPFISFRVVNSGDATITRRFFVDLYLDRYLAYRFEAKTDLAPGSFVSWHDWPNLPRLVRLTPGSHTLRLVVDSTDLVPETDESDNVFEQVFHWDESDSQAQDIAVPEGSNRPNLVPFVPRGWGDAVLVTSYLRDSVSGPLSVDVPTYFRYGFTSEGPISIPSGVLVDLYVDDTMVLRDTWPQVLAEQRMVRDPWIGIHRVLDLEPGPRVVRLVIDPTDLVDESDESDNVYEVTLHWGAGGLVVAPDTSESVDRLGPSPAPLTKPNLVPGWVWRWDGPIIVSHYKRIWQDEPLTIEEPPFVDVVVFNESTVAAESAFSVDLYFDDKRVHRFEIAPGMSGKLFRIVGDWPDLGDVVEISPGDHTLRIVIDPENTVDEADEGDNVFEKTYTWDVGPLSQSFPITYTDAELREMLSDLEELVGIREPAQSPDGADYRADILRTVDAGYYLLTGRSVRDERVNIYLLSGDEYLAWIADGYRRQLAVAEESEYEAIMKGRARDMSISSGYKSRRFGKIAVAINTDPNVADVINSLVHELGHALQDLTNPAQTEAGEYFEIRGIREAEAQQFERAFWLALEEFTGTSLMAYPSYEAYHRLIDGQLEEWTRDLRFSEHALGHLLQWLVPIGDPAVARLGDRLDTHGALDARGSKDLFDYLVSLPPESLKSYVPARIRSLGPLLGTIRGLARSRPDPGLEPWLEGSSDLRIPSLLMP